MNKKTFQPNEWLNAATPNSCNNHSCNNTNTNRTPGIRFQIAEIENLVERIEAAAVDIAPNYNQWRNLGFALADALREDGRNLYHRLSRFYHGYSPAETDKQFDACLNAHGNGVTIRTLFHLAKQAGIPTPALSPTSSISPAEDVEDVEEMEENMPTFSQNICCPLPPILEQIAATANSPEDADLLLLGAITVFSACLPNIYGIYDGRHVYPNIFLFITAQASAGKGRLTLCRHLVTPIHNQLRLQYAAEMERYKAQQTEYVANRKKTNATPPEEPPLKTLFIPANSTSTAVYQVLNDNNGIGLLFETEGDTLANTFKSDYGNFSDGFRKAFHHETISYNRRKDREFVELIQPRLSALLSGTPKQINALIPDAENGLFSRFIFYYMNIRLEWLNVFEKNEETLDAHFEHLGKQFYQLYNMLKNSQNTRFALTKQQQENFNHFFAQVQTQYAQLFGLDIIASVRRLGLITFRIAMILSALRITENQHPANVLVCNNNDFQTALNMANTLLEHTAKVFATLPAATATANTTATAAAIKQTFFNNLPPEFDRKTYLSLAQQLKLPTKTADKYIQKWCNAGQLKRPAHAHYEKANT